MVYIPLRMYRNTAILSHTKLPTLLQLRTFYLTHINLIRGAQYVQKCCSVGWKILPWKLLTCISLIKMAIFVISSPATFNAVHDSKGYIGTLVFSL